ncbi:MAG: hypothetical protein ACREM6_10125, partial [Vulcanimicrobiaceae bacterium]
GDLETNDYDPAGHLLSRAFVTIGATTPNQNYQYDPDGRPVARTSSVYGTQYATYDADGRLSTSVEPAQGGVTSPATLTYSFYPNGMRKGLSVNSQATGNQALLNYAYRPDALRKLLTYVPTNQSFGWAYSNAGRVRSQTDPYTGTAIPAGAGATYATATTQYDQFGRVSAQTLPVGFAYGSLQYDFEGEVTGFSLTRADLVYASPRPPFGNPAEFRIYGARRTVRAHGAQCVRTNGDRQRNDVQSRLGLPMGLLPTRQTTGPREQRLSRSVRPAQRSDRESRLRTLRMQ